MSFRPFSSPCKPCKLEGRFDVEVDGLLTFWFGVEEGVSGVVVPVVVAAVAG